MTCISVFVFYCIQSNYVFDGWDLKTFVKCLVRDIPRSICHDSKGFRLKSLKDRRVRWFL